MASGFGSDIFVLASGFQGDFFPIAENYQSDFGFCAVIVEKQSVVNVFLPLCKTGVLSAFGFCFSSSAGDTTLPLVLAIPKFTTLSLFTYRLAGAYKFNEACAAGSVLAIICAGFFLLTGNGFAKKVFFWKKKENV